MMKRNALLLTLAELWLVQAANPSEIIDNAPFADALTKELYDVTKNECTSSLGVSMAMSLVYPSAPYFSPTELQIRLTLGYPENTQSLLLWENTTYALTDRYQGTCISIFCEPTVAIANKVFVADDITLNPSYESVVGDFVQQLNMSSESAGGAINQWVSESTKGLIDSIVDWGPLVDMLLVALNSIYLKASWDKEFQEFLTNEDLFYSSSDKTTANTSTAHFMHKVDQFPYSHEAIPGFQILQLPLGGNDPTQPAGLSMIIVLPQGSYTPPSSKEVLEALPSLNSTILALALPKFKFESTYKDNLKDALMSLGMTAPFSGGFCIEDGSCSAKISQIIQKTVIDVNEQGVEAAATTAVSMTRGPPHIPDEPILFQADCPFQFFIHDREENLMLFEGQVVEPGITEGSEATYPRKHDDDNFWQSFFWVTPVNAPKPRPTYSITVNGKGV